MAMSNWLICAHMKPNLEDGRTGKCQMLLKRYTSIRSLKTNITVVHLCPKQCQSPKTPCIFIAFSTMMISFLSIRYSDGVPQILVFMVCIRALISQPRRQHPHLSREQPHAICGTMVNVINGRNSWYDRGGS